MSLIVGGPACSFWLLVDCLMEAESPYWRMSYWRGASPEVFLVCRDEGMNEMAGEARAGSC